jgi:hypothetical protein
MRVVLYHEGANNQFDTTIYDGRGVLLNVTRQDGIVEVEDGTARTFGLHYDDCDYRYIRLSGGQAEGSKKTASKDTK